MVEEKLVRHFIHGDTRIDIKSEYSNSLGADKYSITVHEAEFKKTECFMRPEKVIEFMEENFPFDLYKTGFTKSVTIRKSQPEPVLDYNKIW